MKNEMYTLNEKKKIFKDKDKYVAIINLMYKNNNNKLCQ